MDMVGLPAQTQLDFRADGQFVQTQRNEAGAKLTAWGQYELRGNVLVLFTAGWQERQYCSFVGCMPVALPRNAQFYIQFRDANTFQSQSGIFYRIQ
jgi:hypothetical protein